MSDAWDMLEQSHVRLEAICEPDHPRYGLWSMADLACGICPKCGCYVSSDPKVAREIRGRHKAAALDEERLRRYDR